jgi:tRNA(fMet)-specific endonuclease VapC
VPNQQLLERWKRHEDEIAIATIVWHELFFGVCRLPLSARRSAIEQYLTKVIGPTVPILPYDNQAALWHASERARLARQGRTPSFADGQIAAIAQINNLILVTANTTDFEMFQDLRIVNWLDE